MNRNESWNPAFRATREAEGLRIRVPVKADRLRSSLTFAWLLIWAAVEVLIVLLLRGRFTSMGAIPGGPVPLAAVILPFVTIAGGVILWNWMWGLGGMESFLVERNALLARWDIWGFGYSRRFGRSELRSVKAGRLKNRRRGSPWGRMLIGRDEGEITIVCATQIHQYGKGLTEAEAWDLGEVLEEEMAVRFHLPRFPRFRPSGIP